MFDDHFFLYTFQHVWLTKFLAADQPFTAFCSPLVVTIPFRVRTCISYADTKEENLFLKRPDKTNLACVASVSALVRRESWEESKKTE